MYFSDDDFRTEIEIYYIFSFLTSKLLLIFSKNAASNYFICYKTDCPS